MNTTAKVMLAITVAAAAGAAIGILIAPEKGSVLQKKMKDGAMDWLKDFSAMLLTEKGIAAESKLELQEASEETEAEFIRNDASDYTTLQNTK